MEHTLASPHHELAASHHELAKEIARELVGEIASEIAEHEIVAAKQNASVALTGALVRATLRDHRQQQAAAVLDYLTTTTRLLFDNLLYSPLTVKYYCYPTADHRDICRSQRGGWSPAPPSRSP